MLFSGRKPAWLYEALPYVYLVAGVMTIIMVGSAGGTISGLLLVSAGATVWKMRRDYRSRRVQKAIRARAAARTTTNEGAALVNLVWRPSFKVGHELIDRQHRMLFSIGNDLINAIMTKRSAGHIQLITDDLVKEITEHFRTEEEILASSNSPLSDAHRAMHAAMLARINDLLAKFRHGQVPASELIGFIAYDVIAEHITKEDLKFAPARPNGVKAASHP